MKTRWYRRIGGKHVKFNLSKSGVSTSFKLGPITINPQRNRYSINTPVKGLSLRGNLTDDVNEAGKIQKMSDGDQWAYIFIVIVILFMAVMWIF